ncbi:MAG: hypothetical protein JNL82_06710 [Myxococcales bacterium]|nr:hypothetical protein [Myxococcales bacterium]
MSIAFTPNYMPIASELDGEGHLEVLRSLYGKVDARPIPRPQTTADASISYNYYSMSLAMAARVGVGKYVDLDVNGSSRVDCFDFAVGVLASFTGDSLPDDKIVRQTFWGSTVRVVLRIHALDSHVKLDIPAGPVSYAAAVELGRARVEYQVEGVATAPSVFAAVLRSLPLGGRFDVAAHARLSNALHTVLKTMLKAVQSGEGLAPIGVTLQSRPHEPFLAEARTLRWASGQMAAGQSLAQARLRRPAWADEALVTQFYCNRLSGTGEGPIKPADASWAQGLFL